MIFRIAASAGPVLALWLAVASAAHASPAAGLQLSRMPDTGFVAGGKLDQLGYTIPAALSYDRKDGYLALELSGAKGGTLVIDWTGERQAAFYGGGRCFPLPAAAGAMASPKEIAPQSAAGTDDTQPRVAIEAVNAPSGPALLVTATPFLFLFQVERLSALPDAKPRPHVPAPCVFDGDRRKFDTVAAGTPPADGKHATEDWISQNGPWRVIRGYLPKWVPPTFQYTTSFYEARRQQCRDAGRKECLPSREYGEKIVGYGWHCGWGHGSHEKPRLDPVDESCRYHDLNVWGNKGLLPTTAAFWWTHVCWGQSWPFTWSRYFPSSFDAWLSIKGLLDVPAYLNSWDVMGACQ
ncbi:MAG: hypothetical protein JOZ72_18250 [Alphaproteobacteria bacterium]|nr:hypothetical protein [Alphaproteobacteria bacterium]